MLAVTHASRRAVLSIVYSDPVLTIVGRVRDVERVAVLGLASRVFACLLFFFLPVTCYCRGRLASPSACTTRISATRARAKLSSFSAYDVYLVRRNGRGVGRMWRERG